MRAPTGVVGPAPGLKRALEEAAAASPAALGPASPEEAAPGSPPSCVVLDDDEEVADALPEAAARPAGGRTKQGPRKGVYSIFTGGVKPAFGSQPKKAKPPAGAAGKIEGQTVEQWRRAMGDEVKRSINVEKWCVEARTHCTVEVGEAVFRALVLPHAARVVPPAFDAATPVVVAHLVGSAAIGEVFGHSKIKGSTRLGGWSADEADLIFFPAEKRMRVWWTMR